MASSKRSWRVPRLSSIYKWMKSYGSPTVACAILVLMAGNLSATARMHVLLEDLLRSGVVAVEPQMTMTEWTDARGLLHRITSTRSPEDTDDTLRARHDEVVESFLETFPPK